MSWTTICTSWTNSPGSVLAALLLLAAAPVAQGETPVGSPAPGTAGLGPSEVVTTTTEQVLAILHDEGLDLAAKRSRIETLARERFDFDRMARLVLARNWKKLSDEQRTAFLEEFKRHLSLTYGKRIGGYSGETIAVHGTREERNGDVTVLSKLVGGVNDGVEIDYRMRESGGEWRVLDVIVESISLIANFRSQIQEIVSSKGPERLIEILREKNEAEAAPEQT